LLPVSLNSSPNLTAWATLDNSGTVRILVINKDQSANGTVSVSLNGYGNATLTQLLASSYQATRGVTLAGQTFDGSTDGTLQGAESSQLVVPQNGVYAIQMSPTSAALLTVGP
jgi:hypothetical protein